MLLNIVEIAANMVCTILDDNQQRFVMPDRFRPPVLGPCIQGYFPVVDSVRTPAVFASLPSPL